MKPSSNAIALFHNEVLPRPSKEPGVMAWGSMARRIMAGLPQACASPNAAGKSSVPRPRCRSRRTHGHKHWIAKLGRGNATRIFAFLVHANSAVHAIVEDNGDEWQIVLNCSLRSPWPFIKKNRRVVPERTLTDRRALQRGTVPTPPQLPASRPLLILTNVCRPAVSKSGDDAP